MSFSSQSRAWNCDTHIGITMLITIGPMKPGERYWSDPKALCKRHSAELSPNNRERFRQSCGNWPRIHLDMVLGSVDPDHRQRRNAGNAISHQIDSRKRARDAFQAAINRFRDRRPCGSDGAFAHLGHALHYLQDSSDPTKHLDNAVEGVAGKIFGFIGSQSDIVRSSADSMVARYINNTLEKKLRAAVDNRYQHYVRLVQPALRAGDFNELLEMGRRKRNEIIEQFKDAGIELLTGSWGNALNRRDRTAVDGFALNIALSWAAVRMWQKAAGLKY